MAVQGMTIKADRKLLKNLATLPKKIGGKITRGALRAASKMVLADLKPRLPVKTGATKRLARVRAMKRKRGRIGMNVLIAAKNKSADTFYAPFVDLGTKRIKARRNVRAAFDATAERAEDLIRSMIRQGIAEAVL